MHSSAQRRVDLRGISEPPLEVTVEFDIRRGGWQPASRVPAGDPGIAGPCRFSACVKGRKCARRGHRNIRVRCRVEPNRVQGTFPHGAIGRLSSLRKGMLGHGKRRPRREIARFLVANGAGMAAIGTGARCQEALRSRLRIRVFQIGLLRELLPSLRHFLQDPLLLLSCCLLGQTAAFLREALILGWQFHAGANRPADEPFRMHSAPCEWNPIALQAK